MEKNLREVCSPPDEVVAQAIEAAKISELEFNGIPYLRFREDVHHWRRGTVRIGGHWIQAYPSIGRIFVLKRGLEKNFPDEFWLEEKMDGYNIRVVRLDGQIIPFSRGGFVCPFTYDRLPDLVDLHPFFDEHPQRVVCAEIAGPENPYIQAENARIKEDIEFFAFDLMDLDTTGFVPLATRDELFEKYKIPRARSFGAFNFQKCDEVRELIVQLGHDGSEGLVIKPPEVGVRAKYVTPDINIDDIRHDATLLMELPADFFKNRIIRLAIDLDDLKLRERKEEMAQALGDALLTGALEALTQLHKSHTVSKVFSVRLRSTKNVDRLMEHLNSASTKIQVREISRSVEGEYCRLIFQKTYLKSTATLFTILDGQLIFD
ncbi:RNA ligase [Myxococcota bacterium]|nr:RNA ligase [Myxococcota bacterium]